MRARRQAMAAPGAAPAPVFVVAGRPAILTALAFAAGCASYFSLPFEPPLALGVSGLVIAALALALTMLRRGRMGLVLSCLCLLGFAAGHVRAQTRTLALVPANAAAFTSGRPVEIIGWLEAIERNPAGRSRLAIRLERAQQDGRLVRRVRVLADPAGLQPGDGVRVLAILVPPRRAPVPGAYDFRFNAWFSGILASGYAIAPAQPAPELRQDALLRRLTRWRGEIARHIRARLEGRAGALAAALLTGDRSGLPPEATDTLRASGLGHILAISGMHMALFAGGTFLLLRAGFAAITPWARRSDAAIPAAIGALLAATLYFLLSGGSIPTQRAYLMTAAVLTGVLVSRRALSLHTLALAMIFVLGLQPEAIRAPGFQMSFAAVSALIAVAEIWRVRRQPAAPMDFKLPVLSALGGLSLTSLIAGFATSGFAAFHFHRIASFGLIGNLAAMPVFTFLIMPAGAVALILMPVGLDGPALAVMGWGIELLFAIAERVAGLPGAIRAVTAAPGWVLCVYAAGFVLAWFGHGGLRLAGAGLAAIALAGWVLAPAPAIFISETGIVAFEATPGRGDWQVTDRRRDRFAVRVFLEQRGSASPPGRAELDCDDLGCAGRAAGLRYVVLDAAEDWAEDCRRADLIILTLDLPAWLQRQCAARVIDGADLARTGGALIWIGEGRIIRIQRVESHPQARPWQRGPSAP